MDKQDPQPVHLVTHLKRAVPLSLYYFLDGQLNLVINSKGQQIVDFNVGGEVRKKNFVAEAPAVRCSTRTCARTSVPSRRRGKSWRSWKGPICCLPSTSSSHAATARPQPRCAP